MGTHEHGEPRWHRRKEERPAEILDAALEEFTSRGYAAARLEDIARRAGCTKGTIFLYFANKEELFKEVVRANIVPRLEQMERVVDEHRGPTAELLEKVLRMRWANINQAHMSGLPKLMFSEAGNFPELARFFHDELMSRGQNLIARILRLGVERGEFRQLDTANVALAAITPSVMAAVYWHSFHHCVTSQLDPQAFFESSLNVLLRGIAREAAPAEGEA